MKNKQTTLLTSIFILLAFSFIQCDPVSGPGNTNPEPDPPTGEASGPELIAPANHAANQSTIIELKWKQIKEIPGYTIQISENEEFSSTVVDTLIEGTSYTADSLSHESTYFWKVTPGTGPGSGSDTWRFTTGSEDREPIAAELAAPEDEAELEAGDILFEWNSISESTGYHFQLSLDSDFSDLVEDSVITSTSFEAPEMDGDEPYYWRVSPVLNTEAGTWSEMRTFSIVSGPEVSLPDVSLFSPSDGAEDQQLPVILEWDEVSGFEEYQIQLAASDQFQDPDVDETVTGTTYEASGLDEDQSYYWRVRVSEDDNTGEWSGTWSFRTEISQPDPPQNPDAFVGTQNGDFIIDGEVFRFAGSNAYYLPNYEKIDSPVVDKAFDAFEEAGVTVVRMWGFYDGYDCGYSRNDSNENVIQTSPGEYSEQALQDLDRVIAKGKEHGIRFIMPFVNYWDELGGICQYNTWAGASSPGRNMSFFINNSDTQKWFRDYIEMLLNRVNTVTGVAYKDEPAIFSWQIINEGRYTGENPALLRDWYQEMAQYIKSIDPNHLLGTGEEGFDEGTPSEYSVGEYSNTYALRAETGSSYIMNTAIPEIDYGNAHWYGSDYGFTQDVGESHLRAQRAWLTDHSNIADDLGKPFIIGEYGYPGWGDNRVLTSYEDFWNHAEDINLDGSLLWQLTADYVKCSEFGGNICWPEGRRDTDLFRSFQSHIQNMDSSR